MISLSPGTPTEETVEQSTLDSPPVSTHYPVQDDRQQTIARIIARIRESLDLPTIFQTTVREARQLLGADRVGVFQFDPARDWEGEFVSEDVAAPWTSAMDKRVKDHCFSERYAKVYQQGRINAIDDIALGSFSDCYLEILSQFQVQANLVVPLLKGKDLWGLLCIHQCAHPRQWSRCEIEFVSQIAEHLGIALIQTSYIELMQAQAAQLALAQERERSVKLQQATNGIVDKMRRSLDLDTIFRTTVTEVRHQLKAERVVLYRFNPDWSGRFVAESVGSGWKSLMRQQVSHPEICENISECSLKFVSNEPIADTYIQTTEGGAFSRCSLFRVCEDITTAGFSDCYREALETYEARSYSIVAIYHEEQLWGLLAAFQNSGPRLWQDDEISLMVQVGKQLGIALQQAEFIRKLQTQAAQLAKATERQKALAKTIEHIRKSLDIASIFQVTTQEVRLLLEVDRVAIYRFYPDWSGEFVADSIADGVVVIGMDQTVPSLMPDLNSFFQASSRAYPRHETFVPILQGETLWGLLMAYQNQQPRYWQEEETTLLAQVGVQLGVALQQAELLNQTQQQAAKLSVALQEVKQSQSQLIQNEKMASLGQLVAGVAHEINNPVNFIIGNLEHLEKYGQILIDMLQICEEKFGDQVPIADYFAQLDLDFLREDVPKTLASVANGAERIRQIVASLRTFSRLDEAHMKRVNIHEGLESSLLILQHRLKSTASRCEIQVVKNYGEFPDIECYSSQLNQVFMNILSNSIDAIESAISLGLWQNDQEMSPTICIATSYDIEDEISISIIDNGIGIAEEHRSRIFDPFFTTKDVGKGTGLGLAISYQIIAGRHHGQLTCSSEVGYGTEFLIRIPVNQRTQYI
jgi:GAF domain-containing protein